MNESFSDERRIVIILQTVSDMVREAHGLEQLMAIVKDKTIRENKALLAAATGAIWKCAFVVENVKQLDNVRISFRAIIKSKI